MGSWVLGEIADIRLSLSTKQTWFMLQVRTVPSASEGRDNGGFPGARRENGPAHLKSCKVQTSGVRSAFLLFLEQTEAWHRLVKHSFIINKLICIKKRACFDSTIAFRHFTTNSYSSVSWKTATDSSRNAGRRTDDMRQESEIFTTTFFFFFKTYN